MEDIEKRQLVEEGWLKVPSCVDFADRLNTWTPILCTLALPELSQENLHVLEEPLAILTTLLGNIHHSRVFVQESVCVSATVQLDHLETFGIRNCQLSMEVILSKQEGERCSGRMNLRHRSHVQIEQAYRIGQYEFNGRNNVFELSADNSKVLSLERGDLLIRHPLVIYSRSAHLRTIVIHIYHPELPRYHSLNCRMRLFSCKAIWTGCEHGLGEHLPDNSKIGSIEACGNPFCFKELCDCAATYDRHEVLANDAMSLPWIRESKSLRSKSQWIETRQFITCSFHHDGTILDIGCANGYLLACFMSWSKYSLIPYGIEVDPSVWRARLLFPEYESNFCQIGLDKYLQSNDRCGFPLSFDFVYWNVWTNFDLTDARNIDTLHEVIALVKPSGRLVMGLYDSWDSNKTKAKILNSMGLRANVLQCTFDSHMAVLIDL